MDHFDSHTRFLNKSILNFFPSALSARTVRLVFFPTNHFNLTSMPHTHTMADKVVVRILPFFILLFIRNLILNQYIYVYRVHALSHWRSNEKVIIITINFNALTICCNSSLGFQFMFHVVENTGTKNQI